MRTWISKIAIACCLAFVGSIAVATIAPQAAQADDKNKKDKKDKDKKDKASIEDSLGDLKWGMSHDEVQKILSKKINSDMVAKIKGSKDESFADKMRKSYSDRADNMRKSYMQLMKDNVATLSVSIVGEEFMPDNNESLLTQREDIATKYYFFLNDKLYKMAIVYDGNYIGNIAFDSFCATTEAKYGKADDEVWTDDGDFLASIWSTKATTLTVKNKYSSYSTFLMVFAESATEKPLVAQHKNYYDSINNGPDIGDDMDFLTVDSDDKKSLDDILGKENKVDLLAGLSPEERAIAEGKYTPKEVEEKKKAKAKKDKEARKKNDAKVKQGLEIF